MEQVYIKPQNPANWTCEDVLYALEQYTTNKSILAAFKAHNIDGSKLVDANIRQWIASIGITGSSIEVVSKIVQSIRVDGQNDALVVQKLLNGSAAMRGGSRYSLISTALSGSWWDTSSDGDFSEVFSATEDDNEKEDVIIVSQDQTSSDDGSDSSDRHDNRMVDMDTSVTALPPPPIVKKDSATETLSQMMADTDIAVSLSTNKQQQRVAPTLVSKEIPSTPTGNLVDSDDMAARRLWPEPAPLLDRHEACAQLKSAFASGAKLDHLFASNRIQRSPESNRTISHVSPLPYLCESGDSYWFYRPGRCRSLDAESKPSLSQMESIQHFYKQLLLKDSGVTDSSSDIDSDGDDSVLPVYGDSGDDGAYSDHLIAEIDKEQRKIQKSEEAAKAAELQRVKLVEQIMNKRLQVFDDEWQEKEMPKLDKKQRYLWGRHIANRSTLVTKLEDLTSRRLPIAKQSIVESGVSNKAHIFRLCEGLRVTADEISYVTYLLQLLSRPRPLPPRRISVFSGDSSASDRAPKRQSKRRRIVNSDSDDSMDDFIDDEEDILPKRRGKRKVLAEVELPPTPDSDLKQGNIFSSGSVFDSPDSAMTSDDQQEEQQKKHKRQDPCKMEVADLSKAINKYTANDMFDTAMFYIRKMAQGKAAMSRLQRQTSNMPPVDMALALRVWAEYKQWLNAKPESVLVHYTRSRMRDIAVAQLKGLVKVLTGQDKWSNGTTQKPSRRLACQQLSGLANSSVGCQMHLPGPVKRTNPAETGVRDAISAPSGKSILIIEPHILPEALRVLRDNGVAQRAAFAHFYSWRLQYTGYDDVIKIDSDVTSETLSEDLEEESDADPLCDSGSVDPFDQQQVVPSKRSIDSDIEAVSNTDSPVIAPVAKFQKTGKRISNGGRRNIRAIRKENAEVLNMRRQQQMVEEEIERRRKEKTASVSARGEEDELIEEVIASGTMQRSAVLQGSESIDPSKIGRPELINPGHLEYQEDVKIPGFIASHLKSHQIAGIRFMWKNIVMTSNHYDDKSSDGELKSSNRKQLENMSQHGCVLAHSMGLGKTLQTIALIYTIFNEVQNGNPEFIGSIFSSRRVLILCPPTVQANWAAEFVKWTGVDVSYSSRNRSNGYFTSSTNKGPLLPPPFNISEDLDSSQKRKISHAASAVKMEAEKVIVQVINYALLKTMDVRLRAIGSWHRNGGVLIMGYPSFRELMSLVASKKSPQSDGVSPEQQYVIIEDLRRYLLENGPGLVIADEGHNIKNHKTQLSSYANMLRSKARICLTGYPLQNHLDEYWTMVNFCFPGYLGDLKDFSNMYINPIKNGLYLDSTIIDKRTSTIRMKALQSLLSNLVERRDSSVLYHQLPRKVEYIISCPLTELQMKLYMAFLAYFLGIGSDEDSAILATSSKAGLLKFGAQLLTICNHPAICQRVFETRQQVAASATVSSREITMVTREEDLDLEPAIIDEEGLTDPNAENQTPTIEDTSWCQDIFTEQANNLMDARHSTKAQIVLHIIKHSILQGERVLVFSRSIPTLDYLQQMVESSGVLPKQPGSMRIDGSTQMNVRQALIDKFNSGNSSHYVFFISSGTGSIGVNLVAASRIILYDIGWNPLYDEQAVARAYRYGQKRRVYVYRLITAGTWEDRLFNNNVFKVSLTRRVVDKQSMSRRISKEDLGKYFVPPPAKIKQITEENVNELKSQYQDDLVFMELLKEFASRISKVTPQATLLANEDDIMQDIDETELLKLVESEKIRLGLIKAPTPPPQPTTMPSSSQQKPTNANPALPPFQLENFPVEMSLAVLALLQRRLNNINLNHIEDENQMRLLTTMRDLVQNWINWLLSYVNASSPGFEMRNKQLIRVIYNRIPQSTLFVRLVPQLHAMDDMQLISFIRENAPKSKPQ